MASFAGSSIQDSFRKGINLCRWNKINVQDLESPCPSIVSRPLCVTPGSGGPGIWDGRRENKGFLSAPYSCARVHRVKFSLAWLRAFSLSFCESGYGRNGHLKVI